MSKLRPECGTQPANATTISDEEAFRRIASAVARRKSLIHGRLHRGSGYCAIGAFFADNPTVTIYSRVTDEIAAINDSVPTASSRDRWRVVTNWLRLKLDSLQRAVTK